MAVSILYHGHSTFEVHSGDHRLIVDPFLDQNPLSDIKASAVRAGHILLSHAHFDHVADAEAIAKQNKATIYSNFEMSQYYAGKGLNVVGMNVGGTSQTPFGKLSLTLAFHTSTFPDGSPGGVPSGMMIEIGGKKIYYSGDTALFGDMALIGRLWKPDMAVLCIGDHFTMGPSHAALAAEMIGAPLVMPVHYNTFPPIAQNTEAFAEDIRIKGLKPVVLKPGETYSL
jgi:L-ascorbate metabolism protein UlaG (beta-lactamase superfamily)